MFPQSGFPIPVSQFDISTLLNILMVILFFIYIVWGQRIQSYVIMREIEFALGRLLLMKEEAKKITLERFKKYNPQIDPTPLVERMMDYMTLEPVSMDPAGIVPKWDHLLKITDNRVRSEVEAAVATAPLPNRRNLAMVLEISSDLNMWYRIIKHYHILAKRTGNPILIFQLQALLPDVLMQADAEMGGLYAFAYGHPIGDGIGELVAAQLIYPDETHNIAQDMVCVEKEIQSRKVTILKGEGPGGTVGYPGDAVQAVMNQKNFDLVVMIDALVKLEGDKSGTMVEATGAAIGGIGTERYKIEEIVSKKQVTMYGVFIEMSYKECITPLTEALFKSAEKATERVKQIISEKVPEGGNALVVGVGNAVGVR